MNEAAEIKQKVSGEGARSIATQSVEVRKGRLPRSSRLGTCDRIRGSKSADDNPVNHVYPVRNHQLRYQETAILLLVVFTEENGIETIPRITQGTESCGSPTSLTVWGDNTMQED